MANRAYLYPHVTSAFERRLPHRYYDSRHTIPAGWFFFFRARDVVLLDMGGWQQVKLAAPKGAALKRFGSRRPLLDRYLVEQPLQDAAAGLVRRLDSWPGEFLFLDPVELVDDDMQSKSQFEMVLDALDGGGLEQIDEALRPYCDWLSDDADTRAGQLLGYTYWD
jgi:hypothetical protein